MIGAAGAGEGVFMVVFHFVWRATERVIIKAGKVHRYDALQLQTSAKHQICCSLWSSVDPPPHPPRQWIYFYFVWKICR